MGHITDHIGEEYDDGFITSSPVSSESLDSKSWKFIPDEDADVLNAIQNGADQNQTFSDAFDRIEKGFSSGNLSAYLVTQEEIERNELEEEIIYPVLEGEDIRRWRKPISHQKIIYADPNYDIDKYLNIKRYLEKYKDDLEDRTEIKNWWGLRRHRPGAVTDEKKIITPKIAYYTNFTLLNGEEYPVDTIYYAVPKDETDYHFLLSLANSIVMQFYMRMEGTTYRGSYLMYYGNDWGSLPITQDNELEEKISAKTREINEFIEDLEIADEVLSNPSRIYDNFDVDIVPLTEHPAIQSFNLESEELESPVMENNKITFQNLTTEIKFFEDQDEFQELFYRIIEMRDFKMADSLKEIPLPTNDSLLPEIQDALDDIRNELETAGEEMQKLQDDLDELVLDLYSFDDEEKQLIRERTDTPSNPLDTRMVITD